MRRTGLLVLLLLPLSSTLVRAASDDAWRDFRIDVEKSCEKAVAGRLDHATIHVDPFGSETYGVALARGLSRDAKAPRVIVCIYDKRSKRAEASGEFAP
ncbi:hypothetical protein [Methylocystis echinoides]|uniref:hypothetical protein n=1 Tax=Methylocystis echinoides TaxID=29468 RepID=UPI00343D4035